MDWIRSDSLIFEKKIHSYLRVTNFIPKTFIIIIPEINLNCIKKYLSENLGSLDYESFTLYYTIFLIDKCVHSLFQLQPAKLLMKLYRYNENIII